MPNEERNAEFSVGDIVELREPESWLQPYRQWAHEGRKARVVRLPDPWMKWSSYLVEFETKTGRPPKRIHDYQLFAHAWHLRLVENGVSHAE